MDKHCWECGKPLGESYGINLTWVGGPPQRAWCHRWWCRWIVRPLRREWVRWEFKFQFRIWRHRNRVRSVYGTKSERHWLK